MRIILFLPIIVLAACIRDAPRTVEPSDSVVAERRIASAAATFESTRQRGARPPQRTYFTLVKITRSADSTDETLCATVNGNEELTACKNFDAGTSGTIIVARHEPEISSYVVKTGSGEIVVSGARTEKVVTVE